MRSLPAVRSAGLRAAFLLHVVLVVACGGKANRVSCFPPDESTPEPVAGECFCSGDATVPGFDASDQDEEKDAASTDGADSAPDGDASTSDVGVEGDV